MIRSFTACSATIRAMCSIILSCSRIFTASEGASRCSWSLHRFRVPGVMFMSLQQDGPDPGLLGVVLVCHVGGVLGYFGVVVNTPRKLHSAGPTNRDYPTPGTLAPSQASRVKPIQETVVDPADWGNY